MFSLIINIFLVGSQYEKKGKDSALEEPSMDSSVREILALELLVYNFNESLDLSPLFKQVYKNIDKANNRSELEKRLTTLTKEVIEKQVWALSSAARSKNESNVLLGDINFNELENKPAGIEVINLNNKTQSNTRNYRVWVLNHKKDSKELQIQLVVKDNGILNTSRIFWVGPFDFPMLDNTRLPDGQRVSVVLIDWFPDAGAQIALVYFPGSFASLKEKPYYHEVLTDMLKARDRVKKY